MQENYLAKWLNNELTEAELSAFKKTDEFASYERIVTESSTLEGPDFNTDNALKEVLSSKNSKPTKVVKLNPLKKWMQVAAAVIVLLGGSYFYINSLDESISTGYAENSMVTLPDTSEVLLNADSQITYDKKNWDKKRNIQLDGEAFFKVAKGKKFTVATAKGIVTVLGTQFNVENRAGFFEVTCFEGLVSVTFNGKERKLPAGTSFLVVNNQIQQTDDLDATTPSWVHQESSFKSIPLSYVLDEFERQYNITVSTKNIDTQQLYTGTFSNTNLQMALKSISVPTQIKCKLEGNKVLFYVENAP